MTQSQVTTRRDFISRSAATGALLSLPYFIPGRALGLDGAVAPSNKITLGVIGIGPRCTYDLSAILPMADGEQAAGGAQRLEVMRRQMWATTHRLTSPAVRHWAVLRVPASAFRQRPR